MENGSTPNSATIKISIEEFLDIVKETHQSILSQDVLDHYGMERNPNGHWYDRARFSKKASLSSIEELAADNEKMARYIGDAQKLARLGVSTHETKVSIADARKIAGAIKQTYGSDLDGEEIAKAIQEAYAPIVTGSDDTDAWEKSERIHIMHIIMINDSEKDTGRKKNSPCCGRQLKWKQSVK